MKHAVGIMTVSCLVSTALLIPCAKSQVSELRFGDPAKSGSLDSPSIPPLPRGKSTILGGEIVKVDISRHGSHEISNKYINCMRRTTGHTGLAYNYDAKIYKRCLKKAFE